jgi:SUMO ligase MMS21 Smc5/6 complex component
MPIKCDVRCDNIVTDNLIDLTSKNPILIKEKITSIENIQNNNNIKDNVIGLSSKNIPHHVFN